MSKSSLGILTANSCFVYLLFTASSYLEITLFLFFPVATFLDHPFAYMLHFSGHCVLKGAPILGREDLFSRRVRKHQAFSLLFWK